MKLLRHAINSVLIVDDSQTQREAIAQLCVELGVKDVAHAADGLEAIASLSGHGVAPDLLILDLEMPGMDGVELMQQLRQMALNIPFIVASSHDGPLVRAVEGMARNLGLPVVAGLRKPLTRAALARVFERQGKVEGRGSGRPVRPPQDVNIAALAQAISAGEIVPHYQPKVDIESGLVRGLEVLARWTDRVAGPVPADRFIDAAERNGLIFKLSLSVMDQAVAQLARWNARGLRLTLALNVSPRLLSEPSVVEDVSGIVEKHGVSASQIVLEITESSVVSPDGPALGALARFRLRGYGLSIDDYGTGLSSMQQLARIPFTELKVDRTFVHLAHRQENLRVILKSALTMAHKLGLVTVAEGVETMEDWRLLQRYGCQMGQGYLLAKPMPAEELLPWIKAHRARVTVLRGQVTARSSASARVTKPAQKTESP
jgi:EAL domain-containing protein (putative c-di-GMP-specific phosphodiesterase class I)/ActR/RegA family two-component response regulator